MNSDEQPSQAARTEAKRLADASSSRSTASGIFDGGFETYRTVSESDYRSLLTSGLIVLDANVLLNLYRYHAKTREDLIQVLTYLKDRLWVPHQAMYEFWQGRSSVIGSHSREIEGIIGDLLRSRSDIETIIRTWANRVGLTPEESANVVGTVESAVNHVTDKIREISADNAFERAEDTAEDPVVIALTSILGRNVGDPLSPDELRKVKKEAVQRIAERRPPGWKDAGKRENPDGDYIIWFQTLQEAKRRKVDVLLITGDVKDDWWRKERREVKGPLPELVYEMKLIADVRLFMLRPASLLIHAGDLLGLQVSQESVQDAQRVSSGSTLTIDDDARGSFIALTSELLATQQELYLTTLDPSILRSLKRASMELYDKLRDPSTEDPIRSIWPVINAATELGLLGPIEASAAESRSRPRTTKLRLVLDKLYTTAVTLWLSEIANRLPDETLRSAHSFEYNGPFPPLITSIEERATSSVGDRQRVDYVAWISDGREIVVSRIV